MRRLPAAASVAISAADALSLRAAFSRPAISALARIEARRGRSASVVFGGVSVSIATRSAARSISTSRRRAHRFLDAVDDLDAGPVASADDMLMMPPRGCVDEKPFAPSGPLGHARKCVGRASLTSLFFSTPPFPALLSVTASQPPELLGFPGFFDPSHSFCVTDAKPSFSLGFSRGVTP